MATSDSPLSVPDVTLGLALATPDFGEPAGDLAVSASVIAHGEPYTVTGSGFGSSTEVQGGVSVTRKQLWAAGPNEVYEDAAQNTAWNSFEDGAALVADGSAFNSLTNPEASSFVRHNNISRSFRGGGKNEPSASILLNPKIFDSEAYGEKFYMSWHHYSVTVPGKTRQYGYTGLSGVFEVSGNTEQAIYSRGERISVAIQGGGTEAGYVLFVDTANSRVWVEHDAGATLGSGADQAVVVGAETGATLTLDYTSHYVTNGSNKLFRAFEENGTGAEPNPEFSHWINKSLSQGAIGAYDSLGNRVYADGTIYLSNTFDGAVEAQGEWQKLEFWMDASVDPVRFGLRMGDAEEVYLMDKADYKSPSGSLKLRNWGIEISGGSLEPSFFNELFLSNSLQRIEIGDAASYSECSILEVQRIVGDISDESVSAVFNQGALSALSGSYLYYITNQTSAEYPKGVPTNPDNGVEIA